MSINKHRSHYTWGKEESRWSIWDRKK